MYMMYMSITCSMIIIFYSNGGVRPVEIRQVEKKSPFRF